MSELGLIRHRVEVEVEYFLALVAMPLPQLADFPEAAPLRVVLLASVSVHPEDILCGCYLSFCLVVSLVVVCLVVWLLFGCCLVVVWLLF